MQSLNEPDVFTSLEAQILEDPSSMPADDTFDTFRGLLLAGALGLPMWAGVVALCLWIWQ